MINYTECTVQSVEATSVACDVCGTVYDSEMDIQEFHHIDFTGGYTSVFGDMTRIKCDICQRCLKGMIVDYCYYETDNGLVKFK